MHPDHQRYVEACSYPGKLDEVAVERHLAQYLKALGLTCGIKRMRKGGTLESEPALNKYFNTALSGYAKRQPHDARAARAARDAQAAHDARDALAARNARDALDALAARNAHDARNAQDALAARNAWNARAAHNAQDARAALAMHRFFWWRLWCFDLSWDATTHFGAKTKNVKEWSGPLFEAFIAGAWSLHWTEDTLYWIAKPVVHVETIGGRRRLHNAEYAALESDVGNLYFWHGVLVPDFVVTRPEQITVDMIDKENNAEIRRAMVERFVGGEKAYIEQAGATVIHSDTDQYGRARRLLQRDFADDEPLFMVEVTNSTAEPDGSFRKYMLPVGPQHYGGRAGRECQAAIASTWRHRGDRAKLLYEKPEDYVPQRET